MDFRIPEEIQQLCDNLRVFMEEHVYPLEHSPERWTMEVGGPAYPPAIKAVHQKAKDAGCTVAATSRIRE